MAETFSPKRKPGQEQITYFAATDFRNRRTPFGIKPDDRTRHMYIIGKTGMGKSTLLANMAIQDIQNGHGMVFIDPHGNLADLLLEFVPKERIKDVLYFAPFDMDYPVAFNVMEDVGYDKRHLVVSGLMNAFHRLFGEDKWSDRMEYILGNTLLALLEYPQSTLLDINRMYTDKAFRKKVTDNITDPIVKQFWSQEFAGYSERYAQEATPAIQNKIGQFTSNPLIRNIVGQAHSSFDVRKIMDNKGIMIVNLSKGRMGEENANLLGSMMITKIYLAAMSRADLPQSEINKLPEFYMYVDEFQSFANRSFENILSEARKYKLSLTIAHQYIEQMPEEVRAAVFGNVGTMIMFRVGAFDAEVLEKEFTPVFTAEDMVNLGFTQIYLKLMIDGVTSHPFSAMTLPPIEPMRNKYVDEVVANSRQMYAQPRTQVETSINDWYKPVVSPPSDKEGNSGGNARQNNNNNNRFDESDRRRRQDGGYLERRVEPRPQMRDRRTPQPPPAERVYMNYPTEEQVARREELKTTFEQERTHEGTYDDQPRASLSDLARKKGDQKQKAPKDKGPSQEHLADLRAALATALKKEEPTPGEVSAPAPKPKKENTKQDASAGGKAPAQEVPRDVLENILNIEKT